LTRIN